MKIWFHIGNFKTGTTAIQQYCRHHPVEMAENSIKFANTLKHEELSLSLCKEFGLNSPVWYEDDITFGEAVHKLRIEAESSDTKNLLISSEEFSRFGASPERHEIVGEIQDALASYEVYAIYFVRESLAFLSSFYRELCKFPRPPLRFLDFVSHLSMDFLDQALTYEAWADVLGKENVILRKYVRQENHVLEFLRIINPSYTIRREEHVEHLASDVNTSLSKSEIETLRHRNVTDQIPENFRWQFFHSRLANNPVLLKKLIKKIDDASSHQYDAFSERMDFSRYSIFDLVKEELEINGPPTNHQDESDYYQRLGDALAVSDENKAFLCYTQALLASPENRSLMERLDR